MSQGGEQMPGGADELMRQLIEMTAQRVLQFAPHLDDMQVMQLAEGALHVQQQVNTEIIPTLLDLGSVTQYPTLVVRIEGPDGVAGVVKAPKRLEGISDPGRAIHWAMVVALLESPITQAVLRGYGYKVTFAQSAEASGPSRIIL